MRELLYIITVMLLILTCVAILGGSVNVHYNDNFEQHFGNVDDADEDDIVKPDIVKPIEGMTNKAVTAQPSAGSSSMRTGAGAELRLPRISNREKKHGVPEGYVNHAEMSGYAGSEYAGVAALMRPPTAPSEPAASEPASADDSPVS
jgi:hypothetical protein